MLSKLISEINQVKRKGQRIARAIVHDAIFKGGNLKPLMTKISLLD
jgi:hypothetical protein